MNEQEKLILSAFRPSGQDAADPTFAEALAAAKAEPALGQWLEEQQQFDREVTRLLGEVAAPPGLRERILAGARVSQTRHWWQWPQLWAVAAAIVVFFALLPLFAPPPEREVAAWQKHALEILDNLEAGRVGFEHKGNSAAVLTAWLHDQSAPTPVVPAKLADTPTWGCKNWVWEGRCITLMCFQAGEKGVHLFTTERMGLPDAPPEGRPQFAHYGHWFVASWSKGDRVYMLAGEEGEPMLRELIARRGVPRVIAVVTGW